jgi:hypothetical protein
MAPIVEVEEKIRRELRLNRVCLDRTNALGSISNAKLFRGFRMPIETCTLRNKGPIPLERFTARKAAWLSQAMGLSLLVQLG